MGTKCTPLMSSEGRACFLSVNLRVSNGFMYGNRHYPVTFVFNWTKELCLLTLNIVITFPVYLHFISQYNPRTSHIVYYPIEHNIQPNLLPFVVINTFKTYPGGGNTKIVLDDI